MTEEAGGEASNTISGGSFSGPVLQGRDFRDITFVTQQAAAAPVALAQLPPLVSGFTGREVELAQVANLLNPASGAEALVVSAVAGLAGVGKTALAVHAAHAARQAGWFSGGVLFIDLHGYDDNPVQPAQALDILLRALGVAGDNIPEGAEQRAGLYRSALAQIRAPVIVIADNASNEAQVQPPTLVLLDEKVPLSWENRACLGSCPSPAEGTFPVKNTARRPKITVSADGSGIISQAGSVLLIRTLQVTGLDRQLSAGLQRWRAPRAVHDPGKIIADLAAAVALGGDCLADIAMLRAEPGLSGPVASDPVVSRLIAQLAADAPRALKAIRGARAAAR